MTTRHLLPLVVVLLPSIWAGSAPVFAQQVVDRRPYEVTKGILEQVRQLGKALSAAAKQYENEALQAEVAQELERLDTQLTAMALSLPGRQSGLLVDVQIDYYTLTGQRVVRAVSVLGAGLSPVDAALRSQWGAEATGYIVAPLRPGFLPDDRASYWIWYPASGMSQAPDGTRRLVGHVQERPARNLFTAAARAQAIERTFSVPTPFLDASTVIGPSPADTRGREGPQPLAGPGPQPSATPRGGKAEGGKPVDRPTTLPRDDRIRGMPGKLM